MRSLSRLVTKVALGAAAFAAFAAPASASIGNPFAGDGRVVFVQNDNPAGNQVIAYDRAAGGSLTAAGTYSTGGLGGVLTGSVSDHLASQGSLTYDRRHGLLFAVNAGSNSVTVFAVRGDRLLRREVLPSGGTFPVSVAVHGDLAYVVNAKSGGSVQGYRIIFGLVLPLPGSNRPLGLSTAAEGTANEFVNTPGQVDFSPDGSQLVVTTKANGSNIDVFAVRVGGRLSATPVVNAEPGAVPFAIAWDAVGHLVIAEAGTSALATFTLGSNGVVAPIDSKLTGQKATCWVVGAHGYFYASNTGSANLANFSETPAGILTPLAVPLTSTDPGTVDAAATPDGSYLYVQTGISGILDEFHINTDGSLTSIGTLAVPGGAGGEGIVAL